VIQDDSDVRALQNVKVLQEFLKLSKIAQEFDSLFGTHQKVIATLERFENDQAMNKLLKKIDLLQQQLKSEFQTSSLNPEVKTESYVARSGCAISTSAEVETL